MRLENSTDRSEGTRHRFWPLLIAVAIVYVPFGMVFGATSVSFGLSVIEAIGVSMLMFAASAQFAIVNPLVLFNVQAALLMTIAINIRHIVYASALPRNIVPTNSGLRAMLAFCLTDEVFGSVLSMGGAPADASEPEGRAARRAVAFGFCAYIIWVAATAAGAALTRAVQLSPHWFSHVPFVVFLAIGCENFRRAERRTRIIGTLAAVISCGVTGLAGKQLSFGIGMAVVVTLGIVCVWKLCGKA